MLGLYHNDSVRGSCVERLYVLAKQFPSACVCVCVCVCVYVCACVMTITLANLSVVTQLSQCCDNRERTHPPLTPSLQLYGAVALNQCRSIQTCFHNIALRVNTSHVSPGSIANTVNGTAGQLGEMMSRRFTAVSTTVRERIITPIIARVSTQTPTCLENWDCTHSSLTSIVRLYGLLLGTHV